MKLRVGFTLPELILVMGIILTLAVLVSNSFLGGQHQTSLNTSLTTFVADAKAQQLKTMSGDTEGRTTADSYGIYIESNQYVLFHGTTYSASDPANSVIPLNTGLTLSTSFPGSILIFTPGSGEISGFISGSNTITLSGPEVAKIIRFNRYGVIISQN